MTMTTPAPQTAKRANPAARALHQFRQFRRTRPFWGSLVLALGGYFVLKPVASTNLSLLVHLGTSGAQVYIIGIGMLACAAVCLLQPKQRLFPAIMAMVLSVASLPLANLGGWILGMVFGIIGSGLCFAWTPYTDLQVARSHARRAAKLARKQMRSASRSADNGV